MNKAVLVSVASLGGLALMASPLSAATYTIDLTDSAVSLSSQNLAYWDPYYSEGTCSASDGFTPISDGAFVGDLDGFDGGFLLEFDGSDYQDPDDTATREGNTISLGGPADLSFLKVNAVLRSTSASPTLQYLVKMKNPTEMSLTTPVRVSSDLGSDAATTILGDSNDDSAHTNADRWLVSGDAASAPFDDPIVTQVIRGKNSKAPSSVSYPMVNGDECMAVDFSVQVPAGATRYLLFFAQLHDNTGAGRNAALNDAEAFNGQRTMSNQLNGIAPKLYSKIVNWDLKK